MLSSNQPPSFMFSVRSLIFKTTLAVINTNHNYKSNHKELNLQVEIFMYAKLFGILSKGSHVLSEKVGC